MIGLFSVAGCSSPTSSEALNSSGEATEVTATIILQEDHQEWLQEEVSFEPEESLYAIMSENFEIQDQQGFITLIEGREQDSKAQRYWLFTINGEQAGKGAKATTLQAGDEVIFDLASVE